MALNDRLLGTADMKYLAPPPGEEVNDPITTIEEAEWGAAVANPELARRKKMKPKKRSPRELPSWSYRAEVDDAVARAQRRRVRLTLGSASHLLDDLVAQAAPTTDLIRPLLTKVIAAVQGAKTQEQLIRQLDQLVGQANLKGLVQALATATFKARATGDATDQA